MRRNDLRSTGAGFLLAAVLLVVPGACGEGGARKSDVGQPAARHLDGTWMLTLRLERPMSLSGTPAALPFTIRGTVAMMTNERSHASFASIAKPTQIGVYALRLDSLGLLPWPQGDVPTVAAREIIAPSSAAASRDSILVVLNPAMPTRLIRLTGAFVGDVMRGAWTAESPLGGGGTFEMRRVMVAPATTQ
jgi:hypothetical protein